MKSSLPAIGRQSLFVFRLGTVHWYLLFPALVNAPRTSSRLGMPNCTFEPADLFKVYSPAMHRKLLCTFLKRCVFKRVTPKGNGNLVKAARLRIVHSLVLFE